MFNIEILNAFSRMTINNVFLPSRNISVNAPLYFNVTKTLFAEPLKKKKRQDPALIKKREERKLKKMGKQLRRLEKRASILKPVFETEIPIALKRESSLRKRTLSTLTREQVEERQLLFKKWNAYKTAQHKEHVKIINKFMSTQLKALDELRAESEQLYLSAIQLDDDLLPYTAKGPVHSIPIENFDPPEGDYIDISRTFK